MSFACFKLSHGAVPLFPINTAMNNNDLLNFKYINAMHCIGGGGLTKMD
jgi:hypothetical protein